MKKKKDIAIVSGTLVLLVLAFSVIYKNYYNDERNIYIAFFKQFEHHSHKKDAVFISVVTDCNIKPTSIEDASLLNGLYAANSENEKPADITKYSSMVNVVGWKDTISFNATSKESAAYINTGKNIIQISQIGFNGAKDKSILCIKTTHSAHYSTFKKNNESKWVLVESKMLWVQ